MGKIDGRDDEGDEGIAAVVFSVGEDGDFGLEEFLFCYGVLATKSAGNVLLVFCEAISFPFYAMGGRRFLYTSSPSNSL